MKYAKGDMVRIDDYGSPFHGLIGMVVYTDKEALRVDVCPKWYWGEGDVREAGTESNESLRVLPKGTIVEDTLGIEWVKVGSDVWATTQIGFLTSHNSLALAGRHVKRTFLGRMA